MHKTFGCVRFVYNRRLAEWKEASLIMLGVCSLLS
ncbi:helix-turn-helix domain-containing protein [Bacillus cereus]